MPVVDASVVVDWVSPARTEASPAVLRLKQLRAQRADLVAPQLLRLEVGNVLLTGVRRRGWSGTAADRSFAALTSLPIRLVAEDRDIDRAWDLARRYDNHAIYDMLYVALAERMRTVLITSDRALRDRLRLPWVVEP